MQRLPSLTLCGRAHAYGHQAAIVARVMEAEFRVLAFFKALYQGFALIQKADRQCSSTNVSIGAGP